MFDPSDVSSGPTDGPASTIERKAGIIPRRPLVPRCLLLLLILAVALVSACGATVAPSEAGVGPTATASPAPPIPTTTVGPATATPSAAPTPTASPPASCAAVTLATLTEAQRIGQLFVLGLAKDRLDDAERDAVATYHFGSMTFTTQTAAGVRAIRAITGAVQRLATPASTGGVGFFIAANQEGGLIQGLSGAGFDKIPSAVSQGALAPATLRRDAARWGRQLSAAGVDLNFAPVADIVPAGTEDQNAPIGALRREYGHDPATASGHVAAFVAGMRDAGIATTAKHFPGLGRVAGNTDVTASVTDAVTVRDDPFLAPFAAAIKAGVPFVMVSLATYERIDPEHLAVFSPTVIDGMLRGDLGFRGVVMSDALGATAVAAIPPGTRAIDFLEAGGDMIISNQVTPAIQMATALATRAAASPSFRERIDDAALRVLVAKQAAGLLDCG